MPVGWLGGGLNKGTVASACTGESYFFSPRSEGRQFSSSPYIPGAFQAAVPFLKLRISVVTKWVYVGPLRGCLSLLHPSSHQHWGPANFHSQLFWGFLFLALVVWDGESRMWLGSFSLQWEPQKLRYPFQFLTATCGCGTFHFTSPPLLPVLTWLSFYIFICRSSVFLVLKWFSRVFVL